MTDHVGFAGGIAHPYRAQRIAVLLPCVLDGKSPGPFRTVLQIEHPIAESMPECDVVGAEGAVQQGPKEVVGSAGRGARGKFEPDENSGNIGHLDDASAIPGILEAGE